MKESEPDKILNPTLLGPEAENLRDVLRSRIVGQDHAIDELVDAMSAWWSGMSDSTKPIVTLCFAGGSGTGKTALCRALAFALFSSEDRLTIVNCGEFTPINRHYLSRLTGSAPGYIGADIKPQLGQAQINKQSGLDLDYAHRNDPHPCILVFDEFEKSCDELQHLMLSLLDTGKIVMGDNSVTDIGGVGIIILTSNIGSKDAAAWLEKGSLGFAAEKTGDGDKIILDAMKNKFSNEFRGRLSKVVVFQPLSDESLMTILEMQLRTLQTKIRTGKKPFFFSVMRAAINEILKEGTSALGAREIQRTIDKRVTRPLSKLVSSGQIAEADVVQIDYQNGQWEYTHCGSYKPILELQANKELKPFADFLIPEFSSYPEFPSFPTF